MLVADCSQLLRAVLRAAAVLGGGRLRRRQAGRHAVHRTSPATTGAASTPPCARTAGPGCTVFDCFGAGQQVSQVTYGGVSWREHGQPRRDGGRAVGDAPAARDARPPRRGRAPRRRDPARAALLGEVVASVDRPPDELLGLDVDELRARVGAALRRGQRAPARGVRRPPDLAGADLAGPGPARRPTCAAPTCAARSSSRRTCAAPTSPRRPARGRRPGRRPARRRPDGRRCSSASRRSTRCAATRRRGSPPTWPAPPTGADRALGGTLNASTGHLEARSTRRPGTWRHSQHDATVRR